MATLKEWKCAEHGEFESTHPICPASLCASEKVTQEFRTPFTIGTRMVRAHEKGLRRSMDAMGISNLRTAREGEVSKPRYESPNGYELLGHTELAKKTGASFTALMDSAARPLGDMKPNQNSGMRQAATEARITGITERAIPPSSSTTIEKGDKVGEQAARGLLPTGWRAEVHSRKGE
jgi:hypothetical protein